ncbi:33_t:CDS:1, partial [Scutellospora calospora]
YSDSENETELTTLLDKELSDFEDYNIPSNRLSEFEFVDSSDNYIEDKIYDELKLEVKKFFEKEKCSCRSKQPCFNQIGYDQFLARQVEFESLDKKI